MEFAKNNKSQEDFRSKFASIDVLNDDILRRIFDQLDLDDKIRLRRTSSRWMTLLNQQIKSLRALRLGEFYAGGFKVTSGLQFNCNNKLHCDRFHRRRTGTLCNETIFLYPADSESQCFTIKRFDYLHRALKYSSNSITMLSLGRININYRLLIVLTNNLPNLEHLELISCASNYESDHQDRPTEPQPLTRREVRKRRKDRFFEEIPSIENFNNQQHEINYYSSFLLNRNDDEEVNLRDRLARCSSIKNCELIKSSKCYWTNLKHLLIKDCNMLHEFSLCLLMAITGRTLSHLVVESNQHLSGEFLNYCGQHLETLTINYCPSIKARFLEDFIKLKQLLSPTTKMCREERVDCRLSLSFV